MADRLLTLEEAAQILRISKRTLQRRVKSGEVRQARIGHRSIRVAQSELIRYIHSVTSQVNP